MNAMDILEEEQEHHTSMQSSGVWCFHKVLQSALIPLLRRKASEVLKPSHE